MRVTPQVQAHTLHSDASPNRDTSLPPDVIEAQLPNLISLNAFTRLISYLNPTDIVHLSQTARCFRQKLADDSGGTSILERSKHAIASSADACRTTCLNLLDPILYAETRCISDYLAFLEAVCCRLQAYPALAGQWRGLYIPLNILTQVDISHFLSQIRPFLTGITTLYLHYYYPSETYDYLNAPRLENSNKTLFLNNLATLRSLPIKTITLDNNFFLWGGAKAFWEAFNQGRLSGTLECIRFEHDSPLNNPYLAYELPFALAPYYPHWHTLDMSRSQIQTFTISHLPSTVTCLRIDHGILLRINQENTTLTKLEILDRTYESLAAVESLDSVLPLLPNVNEIVIQPSSETQSHQAMLNILNHLPAQTLSLRLSAGLHIHKPAILASLMQKHAMALPEETVVHLNTLADITAYGEMAHLLGSQSHIHCRINTLHGPLLPALTMLTDLFRAALFPHADSFTFSYQYNHSASMESFFLHTPEGKTLLFNDTRQFTLHQILPAALRIMLGQFVRQAVNAQHLLQQKRIAYDLANNLSGKFKQIIAESQGLMTGQYTCQQWLILLEQPYLRFYHVYMQELREAGAAEDADIPNPPMFPASEVGEKVRTQIQKLLLEKEAETIHTSLQAQLAELGFGKGAISVESERFSIRFDKAYAIIHETADDAGTAYAMHAIEKMDMEA